MADVEELVRRTLAGETAAWPALQAMLQPTIVAIARGHRELRGKGLATLPDDLAEITAASLERLARADFRNLRDFEARQASAEAGQAQSFDAWLYGAVDFVIREHLRKRFGRAPKLPPGGTERVLPSKRELHSQAGRLDLGEIERSFLRTLGMTARLTVAEIFAHIERDFSASEARAMRLYYGEDRSFGEIAEALGLPDDKSAERLIRRLNARLRYAFSPPDGDDDPVRSE